MQSVSLFIYSIVGSVALLFAGYNWIYRKEVQRTEKQVGIAIPASILQLLNILSLISIVVAGISFMMIIVLLLF